MFISQSQHYHNSRAANPPKTMKALSSLAIAPSDASDASCVAILMPTRFVVSRESLQLEDCH
jgi:hypothetical protein